MATRRQELSSRRRTLYCDRYEAIKTRVSKAMRSEARKSTKFSQDALNARVMADPEYILLHERVKRSMAVIDGIRRRKRELSPVAAIG